MKQSLRRLFLAFSGAALLGALASGNSFAQQIPQDIAFQDLLKKAKACWPNGSAIPFPVCKVNEMPRDGCSCDFTNNGTTIVIRFAASGKMKLEIQGLTIQELSKSPLLASGGNGMQKK